MGGGLGYGAGGGDDASAAMLGGERLISMGMVAHVIAGTDFA